MATKVAGELGDLGKFIHVSAIFWHPEFNSGRPSGDYGNLTDKGDLFLSMRDDGWRDNGDAVIEVEKISPEWLIRAMEIRTKQWDEFKELAKSDRTKAADLSVFEEIYTEKGKLRPIHYMGVTGNRRSRIYLPAMIARATSKPPLSVTVAIPVKIVEFLGKDGALERLGSQMLENEQKNVGFKEPTALDRLIQSKQAFDRGAKQNWLRKKLGHTTGQKYWHVVLANNLYPSLRIYDRMLLAPDDPTYLNVRSLKGDKLTTLFQQLEGENLDSLNAKRKKSGEKPAVPLTEGDVAEFLSKIGEGTNAKPIMQKDFMERQSTQCGALHVRDVFKGVMTNNADVYDYQIVNQVSYNSVTSLIKDDYGPATEKLLTEVVTAAGGNFRTQYLNQLNQLAVLMKKLAHSPGVNDKAAVVAEVVALLNDK